MIQYYVHAPLVGYSFKRLIKDLPSWHIIQLIPGSPLLPTPLLSSLYAASTALPAASAGQQETEFQEEGEALEEPAAFAALRRRRRGWERRGRGADAPTAARRGAPGPDALPLEPLEQPQHRPNDAAQVWGGDYRQLMKWVRIDLNYHCMTRTKGPPTFLI